MKKSINFANPGESRTVALAKCGFGNKLIHSQTKLTDSQITYRLHKHKLMHGAKFGYRVGYRLGKTDVAEQIIGDIVGVLQAKIQEEANTFVVPSK